MNILAPRNCMSAPFEINPTFCFTLLGAFLIYVWTRPSRQSWLSIALLATGSRAACIRVMGGLGSYYGVEWISWGAFLGIASLVVIAVQFACAPHLMRQPFRRTFFAAAVFPVCSLLIGYSIPVTTRLRPFTYDALLLAFDGGLGFQPSFVLGQLLVRRPTLWGLTNVVYCSLPLAGCLLYAAYRQRQRQSVAILPLFLSLMLVGFGQYGVFPAVGPRYAFAQAYPQSPSSVAQIAAEPIRVGDAPRNCMPSLHLAAALVVLWNSRIWPQWGRLLALLFLLATAFSTLALGEHYVADLVVAFPFTLIFQAAWTTQVEMVNPVRRRTLWAGIGLTVVWFVALRYGLRLFLISPLIAWLAILLTVAWCTLLEKGLYAAVSSSEAVHFRSGFYG